MKNLTLFFCLVLFSAMVLNSTGQNCKTEKGDRAYNLKNYGQAIQYYKNDLARCPGDYQILRKLAECCKMNNQYDQSLSYYQQLVDLMEGTDNLEKGVGIKKGDAFDYADMLLRTGNIKKAKTEFSKLLKKDPENVELQRMINSCDFAATQLALQTDLQAQNLDRVNSPGSEFAPALFRGNLIIASTRGAGKSVEGGESNLGFTDLYISRLDTVTKMFDEPEPIKGTINTIYNDGTFTWSPKTKTAYVTQCKKKPEFCSIYKATLSGEKWTDTEPVSINPPSWNDGHPSLNSDGHIVYFSSDRPGGKGGKDIWKAKVNERDGSFYEFIPLGDMINTPQDEMFPSIIGDSILLFASTGHTGMGGLDIFYSRIKDGVFESPVNAGIPVNSTADDFSILVNKNLRGGYFSSNRPGSTGNDDIFTFPHSFLLPAIRGYVLDSLSKKPLKNVRIVYSTPGEEPVIEYSDSTGHFNFETSAHDDCDNDHKLAFYNEGYQKKEMMVPCHRENEITAYLNPFGPKKQEFVSIAGRVFDIDTYQPIDQALVEIAGESGFKRDTLTDVNGHFRFDNIPVDEIITITVSKEGYFTDERKRNSSDAGGLQLGLTKLGPWTLGDIFYDFDKASLRPNSKDSLDLLVKRFRLNPTIRVEIGSHTDERGTDEYNMGLSERRGRSVVDYLIYNGISQGQYVSKAYGETQPLVRNAIKEEDHQKNRRTTFKIIGSVTPTPVADKTKTPPVYDETINENTIKKQDRLGIQVYNPDQPNKKLELENKGTVKINGQGNLSVQETEPIPAPVEGKAKIKGIIYRVQISASKQPVNVSVRFSKINDLIEKHGIAQEEIGGFYKYQVGNFKTFDEADELRVQLQTKGFRDCFVVVLNK